MPEGLYARALQKFKEEFMPLQVGKTFVSDDVYRFFGVGNRVEDVTYKRALGQVLYNLSSVNQKPTLEQIGKRYRIINRALQTVNWWEAERGQVFPIAWPAGRDCSTFGFEQSIKIYPGDLIVLAGEGNRGKTTFCLNILVENMDMHNCYYFTSEFNPPKFRDRMDCFDWADYMNGGKPKFTVAKQEENWQDIIQPDALNIIDWIGLDTDTYLHRAIMKKILGTLKGGIAVVVLQKRTYKNVGEGGEGTVDLASAYFTISWDADRQANMLKVVKVKTPGDYDPNMKSYSFRLQDGAKIKEIKEVF